MQMAQGKLSPFTPVLVVVVASSSLQIAPRERRGNLVSSMCAQGLLFARLVYIPGSQPSVLANPLC